MGADAELDQVIFDGSSFGSATPAGSAEEADYLGIPGLLDADQMHALLHRRQDEQLQKRAAAAQAAPAPPPSMHGQLREPRRELNTLVDSPPPHRQTTRMDLQRTPPPLRRATDRRCDPLPPQGTHRCVAPAQLRAAVTTVVCRSEA